MRALLAATLLCAVAAVAQARPGGGESFSADDGGAVFTVSLLVIGFAGLMWLLRKATHTRSWEQVYAQQNANAARRAIAPPNLAPLLVDDPDFSRTVFEDFAYRLYADAQRARGDAAAIRRLGPYLAPDVAANLAVPQDHVEQVIVGAMQLIRASRGDAGWQLVVRFEANVVAAHGATYRVEQWRFAREHGRTKPAATRAWPCPSCGAPWQAGEDPRVCAHCGQTIEAGKLDWALVAVLLDSEQLVDADLTGTVPEVGNDFPTVRAPNVQALAQRLTTDDPAVTWPALEARTAMIFDRLNAGWNADDVGAVRGLVTHSLLDYLRYWLAEYRRQGLHNRHDDARIVRFELAKVERDRWYDAVTIRVFATGHDYTLRGEHVVGGSRTTPRDYTEYWTLLRSSARRGPIVTEPRCPNCGAPLQISDAGACAHCQAELENGSFDWVLSRIEQDDTYSG